MPHCKGSAKLHGRVDVVLLDLRLPDMDGLDVCKEMRARSAVPIIIVSPPNRQSGGRRFNSSRPDHPVGVVRVA